MHQYLAVYTMLPYNMLHSPILQALISTSINCLTSHERRPSVAYTCLYSIIILWQLSVATAFWLTHIITKYIMIKTLSTLGVVKATLWDLRTSCQCCWQCKYSRMVELWCVGPSIAKECSSRCRYYDPSKLRFWHWTIILPLQG